MTVLIVCFHLQNETLVNGVQDMRQKIINRGVLISFVGNRSVLQGPESTCFIVAPALGAHEAMFNL